MPPNAALHNPHSTIYNPFVLSKLLIALVLFYRVTLGRFLGGQCRFHPTCSQYAIDAIGKYGPIRGSFKAIWRLMRCHPLCKSGYDPA